MAGTGRLIRTKGGIKFKRKARKVFEGEHDWIKFPEVSNNSSLFYESPHPQVMGNIVVDVIRVKDADTIEVRWSERKFLFPVRLVDIYAPEKNTWEGRRGKAWLKSKIQGQEVELIIDQRNKVGKWGRLLAIIMHNGSNINEELIQEGYAISPAEAEREAELKVKVEVKSK